MQRKKSQKPARQTAGENRDMTFGELITWLRRRHRLRRRYSSDRRKTASHRQIRLAVLFFVLLTVVMAGAMVYVRLHTTTVRTEYRISDTGNVHTIVRNPALAINDVTCSVSVKLGTQSAFDWDTSAMTVADLLDDVGYILGEHDIITPSSDTIIEEGMQISVVEVTFKETAAVSAVPYETIYVDSQTIPKGTTQRISYGTDGIAQEIRRSRYENGVLISSEVISSEVITAPVDEKLYRGVGGIVYGADGAFRYSYYIDVIATAYGGYDELRYTYSGTPAVEGVIAVDPDIIPLGTKVYVKGSYGDFGVCSADDIGTGIKDHRIDIYMNATQEEMMEFGRRNMRVYILEEET